MRNATEFYAQQVSNFPCDKSLMCKKYLKGRVLLQGKLTSFKLNVVIIC